MRQIRAIFFTVFLSIVCVLQAQISVTIGSGTASTREIPVTTSRAYTYSQQIFLQSEINKQGTITKIRFYMTATASLSNSNKWVIYLGHVGQSSFSDYTDWIPVSAMTQVYSGYVSTSPPEGWYEITLTTPFVYNNTQNLVLAVDENQSSGSYFNYSFYVWTPATANRTIIHASGTNPSPSNPPADATSKTMSIVNQVQFEFLVPAGGDNPSDFSANGVSGSRVNLSWNNNNDNDPVMLAWNSANEFGTPVNGEDYEIGDEIPGGGTVFMFTYNDFTYHDNLQDDTPYYYKAWSKASYGGYATGVTASATTLCANISPPWLETFPEVESYQFPLCWTEGVGYLSDTVTLETNPEDPAHEWWKDDFANVNDNKPKSPSLRIDGGILNLHTRSWLFSPAFNLGTAKPMYLQFDKAYTSYNNNTPPSTGGNDDKFAVVISTDRGETWCSANTIRLWDNAESDYVLNDIPHDRTTSTISLDEYSGVVKIGFYGESTVGNADNQLFIDNVEISSCPRPTNITTGDITTNTANITWEYEGPVGVSFDVLYDLSTDIVEPISSTTPTVSSISGNSYQLTNLAHANSYTYYVRSNCGGGDVGYWQGPFIFETLQTPATLPYADGFETWPYGWTAINENYANKWFIGSLLARTGSQSAYISTFGSTHTYSSQGSIVNLYRDIAFPSSSNAFKIEFDWISYGNYNNSMSVYLIPDTIVPENANSIFEYKIGLGIYSDGYFHGASNWVREVIELTNVDFAGQTKRLVFRWTNGEGTTNPPPAAIDNVEVYAFDPLSTVIDNVQAEKELNIFTTYRQIHIWGIQPHAYISLFNTLGQKIMQQQAGTTTHEVLETGKLSGTYIIVINHNEQIIIRKITIM